MTTPNSNSPPGSVENVDTGPLSWVMVEIRESLNRSRAALQEALTQDAETQGTTLRHAKSFLHQAHGALQIVDVDGARGGYAFAAGCGGLAAVVCIAGLGRLRTAPAAN